MPFQSLFECRDYKEVVLQRLSRESTREKRGERTRLAQAIKCNVAYISQVLSGPSHLSLEQAQRACRYFSFSPVEEDFFLTLVQLGRAGTSDLKIHFEKKLAALEESQRDLKQRLSYQRALAAEDQAIYYGLWYFTAVHFLASIPEYQTVERISRHLGLSKTRTSEVLQFLVEHGLVQEDGGGHYRTGPTSIHLGSDSPMLSRHHSNWRMQAIADLDRGEVPKEHLHFSSVVTLADSDVPRVREILVEAIEKIRAVVKPSNNEKMMCYSMDFFGVGRS